MKWAILTIMLLLVLAGCTQTIDVIPPETGSYEKLTFDSLDADSFNSKDELLNFIRDNEGSSNYGVARSLDNGMMVEEAMVADVAMDSAPMEKGGSDFSETNNQVASIDEADLIKTDGEYIYTISGKTLFIVKAYPGEVSEVVSKINFDETPSNLFISGDKLAVFGNLYDDSIFRKHGIQSSFTFFKIYDISNKQIPNLEKEMEFEGNYFRGRMYEDKIYLITSSNLDYRIDYPMPVFFENGLRNTISVDKIYYYPIPYNSPSFANIFVVNMEDDSVDSQSVVVENGQNMYMSEENIYITYTEWINEWEMQQDILMDMLEPQLSEYELNLIGKIKNTDNDVLSRNEKENKIFQVYENFAAKMSYEEQEELQDEVELELKEQLEKLEHMEFTIINKVDVETVEPVASGKVPGSIVNQFSMDENEGVFRIATTLNTRWSRFAKDREKSTNNVYTLDEDLKELDSLEGIAEDERIYSTRFIEDKLYMVTFKQVDPFFVIDLSDPSNIESLGELKIPGFSRYLHPYDEDTIIGIGQDASETGRTTGLKISLFDVGDVTEPKEVASFVTEERYASSTALYEHKAFLFSKEKNLLVIPAYSYDYNNGGGYNGAFVFNISKDSIELRGLIDHGGSNYYSPSVERSLYIEELLYTKSPSLLRVNAINDLTTVKKIDLKEEGSIPIY